MLMFGCKYDPTITVLFMTSFSGINPIGDSRDGQSIIADPSNEVLLHTVVSNKPTTSVPGRRVITMRNSSSIRNITKHRI